jgi:hypothetical protein
VVLLKYRTVCLAKRSIIPDEVKLELTASAFDDEAGRTILCGDASHKAWQHLQGYQKNGRQLLGLANEM